MAEMPDAPLDSLWKEYSAVFRDFDDLTLARWLCQTLGQLEGRVWRLSHPLVATYRIAAQVAQERQIWLKRLATTPRAYSISPCCRAPLLPVLSRDVLQSGLVCHHCGDSCVPFQDIPKELQGELEDWAEEYGPIHAVAHCEDEQRKRSPAYEQELEQAARQAEEFLKRAGYQLAPKLLEHYPSIIWEDQDTCLDVQPEDLKP